MTEIICPIAFADLLDYWSGDLSGVDAERIEKHIFICAACAGRLSEIEALGAGIVGVVRQGRFHAAVTEAVLNRLARDGVRIRTYALEPGDVVPCAVFEGDQVVVTRLRGDFSGVDSITLVTRFESGEEMGRLSDVPVARGQHEILDAISVSLLRTLPSATLRLTLTGRTADDERTIGEYVLEHASTFDPTVSRRNER